MKNSKKKIIEVIFTILLFPALILFLLVLLIITPFDYIKYRKSLYYKDTKDKYSWFCTSSYYVKFYDMIKKENLPIDYYHSNSSLVTGYGYFMYKDILILNDYDDLVYSEEKNTWLVEIEDEYVNLKDDVDRVMKECNELLENDRCKKAVVLIDRDLIEEYPDVCYENLDFLPVRDSFDIEAVKTIIKQG